MDNIQPNSKEVKVDVLISGAGPVGLAMAHFLAKANVNFMIIEKRAGDIPYSRAFAIHSRTLEIFDQIGVVDEIIQTGRKQCLKAKAYLNKKLAFEVDLPPSKSSHPYLVGLIQSETERILEKGLNSKGHKVLRGVELESLTFDETSGDAKTAVVKYLSTGEKGSIKFKYLVACDGGKSIIRKMASIPFNGESVNINLTCFDAYVESDLSSDLFGSFFFEDTETIAFIWLNDESVRFITPLADEEPELNIDELKAKVTRMISPHKMDIKEITWVNTFRINECRAETHYKNNVFLCGDAAHVHSPAGGQGMNTGIQDAYNLAWKLALMVKGLGNDLVLKETFDTERTMVADMVLKNSGTMARNVLGKGTLFNKLLKQYVIPTILSFGSVQEMASESISEVGIKYEENKLIKSTYPGWLGKGSVPGVGLRIMNHKLVDLSGNITDIHKILKGGNEFETLVYIPDGCLTYDRFTKLKSLLLETLQNPDLIQLQKINNITLFNLSLIINIPIFQASHWTSSLTSKLPEESHPDISKVGETFNIYKTYLDQEGWAKDNYSISSTLPSVIIIRPDGHIGKVSQIKDHNDILDYFKEFINLS